MPEYKLADRDAPCLFVVQVLCQPRLFPRCLLILYPVVLLVAAPAQKASNRLPLDPDCFSTTHRCAIMLDGVDTPGTPSLPHGLSLPRFASPALHFAPGRAVLVVAVQRLIPLLQSKTHRRVAPQR